MTTENGAQPANRYADYWLRVDAAFGLGAVCTLIPAAILGAVVRWGILYVAPFWATHFGQTPPAEGSPAHAYWVLAATAVGLLVAAAVTLPLGFRLSGVLTPSWSGTYRRTGSDNP